MRFKVVWLFIVSSLFLPSIVEAGIYFGNLHAHTAYSDGQGDPAQAFQHARNIAGLDFQAVTDHAYYFVQPLADGSDKFTKTREYAEDFTEPGVFVAIAGFEWTGTGYGHINIYNTKGWISRDQADLFRLYEWIVKHKALAQFNHPVREFGDNFREFLYFPEVDKYINLIEVGNGNWAAGDIISEEMEAAYRDALRKGWHVGATANQDNHKPNWGSANDARTAVIAENLSYDSIMEALKRRHVYATEDKNARVFLFAGSAMMGDILYDATRVTLHMSFEDIGDPVSCATLVTSHREIPVPVSGDSWDYSTDVRVEYNYEWVYLRIKQKDGDNVVTSPIWFQSSSKHYALNPSIFPTRPTQGEKFVLRFDLVNWSEQAEFVNLSVCLSGNPIFDQTFELQPISRLSTNIELSAEEEGPLQVYVDGELAWEGYLHLTQFSAILDTTHENGYEFENSELLLWLESVGGRVEVLRGRMRANSLKGKRLLILPLPESGGIAPIIKKLNTKEIGIIVDHVSKGGLLILVSAKEPIESDVVDTYNTLLKRLGFEATFSNDGTKILEDGEEKKLVSLSFGQGYVLVGSHDFVLHPEAELEELLTELLGVNFVDDEE
ncbi:MAG: phosphotransferase [Thermotogae bacterium]|nr:MAG: phosphotransferase [Thermotogota bacterium]